MLLSNSTFENIIRNTPLISIDLCILKGKKILIGKRINCPARNTFFVPGGRILKSEKIDNAIKRILKVELGLSFISDEIKKIKQIGVYEHFYKDNFLCNTEFETHYIVLAYLIPYQTLKYLEKVSNDQHSEYIWFDLDRNKLSLIKDIHPYTVDYFNNPIIKKFIK